MSIMQSFSVDSSEMSEPIEKLAKKSVWMGAGFVPGRMLYAIWYSISRRINYWANPMDSSVWLLGKIFRDILLAIYKKKPHFLHAVRLSKQATSTLPNQRDVVLFLNLPKIFKPNGVGYYSYRASKELFVSVYFIKYS